jgi:large subunit ribosomal protein L17
MKHRVGFNKLSRKSSHRKAMTRNMVTSLFRYERITTTKAKALEVRKTAEKMITRAKSDSVHNRRIINKDLKDAEILNKLFVELGPVNKDRLGGYTRIIKTGQRKGDAAEMVILELVLDKEEDSKKKKPRAKKKKAEAPATTKTVAAEAETEAKAETEVEKKAEAAEAEVVDAEDSVEESKKSE